MILATWLSEAAKEEQTSVLLVILKVLMYVLFVNYACSFNLVYISLKANFSYSGA